MTKFFPTATGTLLRKGPKRVQRGDFIEFEWHVATIAVQMLDGTAREVMGTLKEERWPGPLGLAEATVFVENAEDRAALGLEMMDRP